MNREARAQDVEFPQQFGKYQLIERLAIGGMAEIYRAKTTGIGGFEKVLVIKKLHDRLSQDDEFIEMMVDEAKIAVRLNHPNIAKVFDLGRIQTQYFIAMEYIEGPDLSRVLGRVEERGDLLPVPAVLFIGAECCSGLHYAHTRRDAQGRPMNIVHRDVSPPNIMLSVEGEVKIVDFGIAKARKRVQKTRHGIIKGKFHYMAPEQAQGNRVDQRTDVFSIGIVLYEMLTGRNPYDGTDENDLLDAVRLAEIPPLRKHRRTLDPELDNIIMQALQRNPEKRYRSAAEFDRALTGYRERKCDPFERRRLSELTRNMWSSMEGAAGVFAEPNDVTGRMSPVDFQAGESSVIYAPGEGHALNQEAEFVPDEPGGENPFDEEVPTQIWDGGDDDQNPNTRNERPSNSPPSLPESMLPSNEFDSPADQGRPLPPPPDDNTSIETPTPQFEGSSEVNRNSEFIPSTPAELEPTPEPTPEEKSKKAERPKSFDDLVARLEEAGIDRRVQLYVGVALSMMLITGVGLGMVTMFSSGDTENIEAQKEQSAAAAPAESKGSAGKDSVTVSVDSRPSNASVRVDGKLEGKTPISLDSLEVGRTYEITVEQDGYRTERREFTPDGEKETLSIDLKKADGVLRISTYPTDAEIELNGETVGYSPVTVTKLERDREHDLEAHLEGETVEETVEWKDDDDAVMDVRLRFEDLEEEEDDDRERHASRSHNRDRDHQRRRVRRDRRERRQPSTTSNSGSNDSSGSSGSTTQNTDLFSTGSSGSQSGSSGSSTSGSGSSSSGSSGGGGEGTNLDIWNLENSGPGPSVTDSQGSQNQGTTSGGKGFISVQVKKGWGKVYVDGNMVASETPLINYAIDPGSHKVKVYYPVLKRYSKERTVNVKPGKTARAIFSP
mgnify:CR=1 FL=1